MNQRVVRAWTVSRAIVHELRVERVTFLAGSIAYNAFVSLLPLLFLLLAVVSAVGNQRLEAGMVSVIESVVTPGASEVLVDELRQSSTGASLIGLAALVWGTLRIFRSLDTAFSDIYETEGQNTFLDQLLDGVIVFGSIAAVVVCFVAVESVVAPTLPSGPAWALERLLLGFVVALALVPIYYLFPDESGMALVEVVPGVAFAASALVVFQAVFGLYIQYSSQTAQNTLLASILVFLTWLYVSGLVLLVGAVINAVLSNRSTDVNVRPVLDGVPKSATADSQTVPVATLDRLGDSLGAATEFTISFDGESVTLSAPDSVSVETDTSVLPGVAETTSLTLAWTPDRVDEGQPGSDSET